MRNTLIYSVHKKYKESLQFRKIKGVETWTVMCHLIKWQRWKNIWD